MNYGVVLPIWQLTIAEAESLTVREGRSFARGVTVRPATPPSNESGAPAVKTSRLRVARGGRDVLRGIDLAVREGEILAVAGRNGSGKTTLLRALIGLLSARGGSVEIAGFDPAKDAVEIIASRVAGLK